MVSPNASGTLLLERPLDAPEHDEWSLTGAPSPEPVEDLGPEVVADGPESVRSILRAPGLALLAAAFLIEGYRWLGVIHVGSTVLGSVLFGSAGLALVVLAAPWAALFLTSRRHAESTVIGDLVTVAALASVVATVTALVVGGQLWRTVAGITDLVLAATALAAVVLGERARRRIERVSAVRPSGTF